MQISKNVVVAAAIAFLALFGAVFFLLGRESNRRRSQAIARDSAEPAASPAGTAQPGIAAGAQPAGAPALMPSVAPAAPASAQAPAPPLATDPPGGPDATSVARDYFASVQAIQTFGPAGDTGEFANKLLVASMNGDSSGFDDLIKVMQDGSARVQAITPPACCVEYHHQLLGMLAESVEMMRGLKAAIAKNDAAALTSLAASGSSLQTRANALDAEAKRIKKALGIPH